MGTLLALDYIDVKYIFYTVNDAAEQLKAAVFQFFKGTGIPIQETPQK
jgi:hypothetical protein